MPSPRTVPRREFNLLLAQRDVFYAENEALKARVTHLEHLIAYPTVDREARHAIARQLLCETEQGSRWADQIAKARDAA